MSCRDASRVGAKDAGRGVEAGTKLTRIRPLASFARTLKRTAWRMGPRGLTVDTNLAAGSALGIIIGTFVLGVWAGKIRGPPGE
jgi:hypothetical protein